MPLLTLTSTKRIDPERKDSLFSDIATLYADAMDSDTSYLSIHYTQVPREDLWLGRAIGTGSDTETAPGSGSDVVVLEADVREGRPLDQRRTFARTFIETINEEWGIPTGNVKVVFTEHDGTHMMGYDRIGGDWSSPDED